jgi:microcystin-dependent protein
MDPFVGEIRMFAGNFAPKGWALCNGQVLPISQNTALFSLLGTNYGGDGRTTFALPDLQERVPLHAGSGPGLSRYDLGERFGQASVALTLNEIPGHAHSLRATGSVTTGAAGSGVVLAPTSTGAPIYRTPGKLTSMDAASIAPVGGGQPHNNWQPYLVVNFIIALQGIFPPRP